MKKIYALILFFLLSCQKEDLKVVNPNSPGLASLNTEAGMKAFAFGLNEKAFGWIQDGWLLIALGYHSAMGDEIFIPWGNFNYRWTQQYFKIRLPNGQEYKHAAFPDKAQQEELQAFNTRSQFSGPFSWEWYGAYLTIGQANELLEVLNDPESPVVFSGSAQTKINALKAWALWWKGYMYSRIGSMYLSGVITDQLGATNGEFQDHTLIIDEATRNFDEAISILNSTPHDADYEDIMLAIIPDFNNNQSIVSPGAWIRMMNTYKARNIIANNKVTEMTSAQWNEVLALCQNGLQASDNIFTLGMTPDGVNDLATDLHPFINCNEAYTWWFASERLIQDYYPNDLRLAKDFHNAAEPSVNIRNRGWTFGTRYAFTNIEDGGAFATGQGMGQWPISPTYEENQLMIAEAQIRTGNVEAGLQLIDEVRAFQSSGLAPVAGTGLSLDQAVEELRRERRVALVLRGLAFYDARRWGVIAPESENGGRSGAMIMVPANVYDPESDGVSEAYPCFLEYNYMDYWDVPANELDLNPSLSSAAIRN